MKVSDFLSAEIASAKLETDPNGHTRVIFDADELAKINGYLKSNLESAYEDWTPVWNDAIENYETYRTVKIPIPDGGTSFYPAPIARVPADQIIASVYNAIMRPRPIFSIDAYLDAEYQVPTAPLPQQAAIPGQPPPMQQPASVATVTSEEVAHNLQQGYDFVVRERIGFDRKLLRGVRGAVQGQPYWWKVVADPEQHTGIAPKVNGAVVDLADKYEETRQRGDLVKWYLVPFTNCMMPIGMVNEEAAATKAAWFAERKPMLPDELIKRYEVGELFLLTDKDVESCAASTVDQLDIFHQRQDATTGKRVASTPSQVIPNWLTWFYWNVEYVDPSDGQKKVKRLSLLGDFHLSAGKLMTCYLMPYEHQERPYELVDQMDDGDCTVARLKYHQTVFTYLAQAEIRSAHVANHHGFWHDPNNSDVHDFFAKNTTITSGDHIPGIMGKDWGTYALGAGHFSVMDTMKFVMSMSQLDSRENDFTMGGRPPGRTPAQTVEQVYQHAEEVKTLFLARLSTKLSRLLRLDAETRRQYQPLGEILPAWNPESKSKIEIPFRFPVGAVLDNFRVALTAADEVLTAEKDPQQVMLRKQALMADGEWVAKLTAAIINIQTPLPQSAVDLFVKIAVRDQKQMRALMGQVVTDEEEYDLTKQIEAIVAERNATLKAQAAAPPPPPKEQPPELKISLSGQIGPEIVATLLTAAGIQVPAQGAMNAGQAGPQATPPSPNAGPGNGAGASPPPSGQPPVPQPPAPPPAPSAGAVAPAPVQ